MGASPRLPRPAPISKSTVTVEPCPNCQQDASGGYCPNCGWVHCNQGIYCTVYGSQRLSQTQRVSEYHYVKNGALRAS